MAAHRHRLGAAVLLGTAIAVSACDSSEAPAASRPASSSPAATPASPDTAAPVAGGSGAAAGSATPPATPSPRPHLLFPNTATTVQLVGYDSSLHMLEFRKVVGIKTDDGTGHLSTRYYEPDPADRATHRLPLSPDADIVSVDAELCPPTHCGPSEVMLGNLLATDGQPVALIRVDASDHIYLVSQSRIGMGADAPPPQSA